MTPDAERARILAAFQSAGAEVVDLPVLQSAETLLDLYGEDIRGRAYTTRDPLAGELMMRPDFTVPVVEMHVQRPSGEARYAYAGKVFRVQELNVSRPSEYDQVGFELFGHAAAAEADAEVFALFSELLPRHALRVATGDIGVLRAAVEGLTTTDRRKQALLRHLWRPGRFRKLLERFSTEGQLPERPSSHSPMIGARGPEEIDARLQALAEDAAEPPIPASEAQKISALLAVKAALPQAIDEIEAILGPVASVAQMKARLNALVARGVDASALIFEGSYGRSTMEYYDGFVFGFYTAEAPLPPVSTGGRYDALTRAMGRPVPAVGGMIRPALLAEIGL